jgi:nitrogen-specific signal transduction histidine kinase
MGEKELAELKTKLNKSMAELVRLILQQKKRIDALEDRINVFNAKAGHKL